MPPPEIRVYLSPLAQRPILGSVNTILNGLIGASLGCFPNRHPWDRVDLIASDVHDDREYYPEIAARVLTLRNVLKAITSNRLRLDVIDITLCIFAVGVAKRAKTIEPKVARTMKLKLEKLRKRAMHALIKRSGEAVYQEAAGRCRRFEAWCRYHLLYFHLPPRNRPSALRLVWGDQVMALHSAAQEVVAERSYVTVPKMELQHQAKLALAELRRGRHDTSPMELLRNPQQAKEFMFTFVSKRIDLRPLKPRWMTLCERQGEIGEKLKVALVIEDEGCVSPEMVPAKVPATPTPNPAIPAKVISQEQVQVAVTSWIWTNVNTALWGDVMEEVTTQVYRLGRLPPRTVASGSLQEIIEAHRPILTTVEAPVLVGQLVEWLLNWTMTLNRNPYLVCNVIQNGFAQAMRESKQIA